MAYVFKVINDYLSKANTTLAPEQLEHVDMHLREADEPDNKIDAIALSLEPYLAFIAVKTNLYQSQRHSALPRAAKTCDARLVHLYLIDEPEFMNYAIDAINIEIRNNNRARTGLMIMHSAQNSVERALAQAWLSFGERQKLKQISTPELERSASEARKAVKVPKI